jgi:large subunit ribosomal protein L30
MILRKEEKSLKEVMKMQKIKITQLKSPIGRNIKQRKTLISLGLNKINRERTLDSNPAILGMINKVKHLIKVEEVK